MYDKRLEVLEQDVARIIARELPWERLAGCRIVVTGAGGFLGGYLVRTLLSLHRLGRVSRPVGVVGLVRDPVRAGASLADVCESPQLEFLRWDLSAIALPALGPAHYVLHAASQASPRFYGTDPVGTLLPNSIGTAALLEALRQGGAARGFLFVSSSEVYGAVTNEASLGESDYGAVDPASVRACYAESKRMGETMCVAWLAQHRLPTFIVRPFHTYGPGLTAEDGRVFADFAYDVARNRNIVMHSDGAARRSFCYASDAVAGFFTALLCGQPGQPYNVANPAGELSVAQLADLLVSLFPDKRLSVERRFESGDPTRYLSSTYSRLIPDVSRLRELGWRADIDPATGFKRMIETLQA